MSLVSPTTSSADTWGWLWQKTFSFSCATIDGTVASSSFGPALCFVVLRARACPLKDDSSLACLDHAVHMINSKRWSWWFIGGPTMTPRLPRGTTVPGFVLEQTTTKQWLKQTLEDKLDERRFFYVWDDWLNFFFFFFKVDKLYSLSEKFGWSTRLRSRGKKKNYYSWSDIR